MVLSCFQAEVWGQTINGKVIDSKQQPIDGATIVLQAIEFYRKNGFDDFNLTLTMNIGD